jgi:hypothetical protein
LSPWCQREELHRANLLAPGDCVKLPDVPGRGSRRSATGHRWDGPIAVGRGPPMALTSLDEARPLRAGSGRRGRLRAYCRKKHAHHTAVAQTPGGLTEAFLSCVSGWRRAQQRARLVGDVSASRALRRTSTADDEEASSPTPKTLLRSASKRKPPIFVESGATAYVGGWITSTISTDRQALGESDYGNHPGQPRSVWYDTTDTQLPAARS